MDHMKAESESRLVGHWIHAHEEDTGNQMVFRPSTHPFPPSRGRYEYKLETGGMLRVVQPGPTDKRESTGGTWEIEEGGILVLRPSDREPLRFRVLSVDKERLIVNRL